MNIETELQIAIENARRSAVRSGMEGDDAIVASILADPAVAALMARPEAESLIRLRMIEQVARDIWNEPDPTIVALQNGRKVLREFYDPTIHGPEQA